jgi:uncharacterized membrane protein YccC
VGLRVPVAVSTWSPLRWLRTRDAGLAALRRAARAAIAMPLLFALTAAVLHNADVSTFAAFGSFAMLLLADFGGSMQDRLMAQIGLVGVGAVLVSLGTLASGNRWSAVAAMAVVGFGVLFAGVVSSVLASATTAALLSFILPVMLPGGAGAIPARLVGWLLAGAVSVLAIGVLWPAPAREPLRGVAAEACRRLALRLQAEVDFILGGRLDRTALDGATAGARAAVERMRSLFFATPYRPTGLTTAARTVVRLVDEVVWLGEIMDRAVPGQRRQAADPSVCAVRSASAALLEHSATVLERPDPADGPVDQADQVVRLEELVQRLQDARGEMERAVTRGLPVEQDLVSSLEPSFRAQEMSFAIAAIAANIAATDAAGRRSWWQRLLGRQPAGITGPLASAQERAGAHLERHSVSLRNSLRGALALAAAVAVADLSGVQHSFWVVLGTLAVLRSNALSTGQNAVRALGGTVAGVVIGGVLVALIGTNAAVLWVVLPLAILFAGLAPATISFAAGQAAFTIVLMVLFNIIAPTGWSVGLVRIEDVALGCLVSLVVGVLFWPRGATSVLGRALAEAYQESARYLRVCVDFGLQCCTPGAPPPLSPRQEGLRAAAAARRLDDAFRGFLAERGAKHLPLAQVTTLVTGVVGLRLTADAVLDLWSGEDGAAWAAVADRAAARVELLSVIDRVAAWYEAMALTLTGGGPVPEPIGHDRGADARFVDAVRRDVHDLDGNATAEAVRMIWSGDHVDAARRLQRSVAGPARAVVAVRQRRGSLIGAVLRTTPLTES